MVSKQRLLKWVRTIGLVFEIMSYMPAIAILYLCLYIKEKIPNGKTNP